MLNLNLLLVLSLIQFIYNYSSKCIEIKVQKVYKTVHKSTAEIRLRIKPPLYYKDLNLLPQLNFTFDPPLILGRDYIINYLLPEHYYPYNYHRISMNHSTVIALELIDKSYRSDIRGGKTGSSSWIPTDTIAAGTGAIGGTKELFLLNAQVCYDKNTYTEYLVKEVNNKPMNKLLIANFTSNTDTKSSATGTGTDENNTNKCPQGLASTLTGMNKDLSIHLNQALLDCCNVVMAMSEDLYKTGKQRSITYLSSNVQVIRTCINKCLSSILLCDVYILIHSYHV